MKRATSPCCGPRPAGITPPLILSFNASSVPILQLALSSSQLSETTLFDDATSFIRPQLASAAGAAIPLPYGGKVRQVQADLNQQALRIYSWTAFPTGELQGKDVPLNGSFSRRNGQSDIVPKGNTAIGHMDAIEMGCTATSII